MFIKMAGLETQCEQDLFDSGFDTLETSANSGIDEGSLCEKLDSINMDDFVALSNSFMTNDVTTETRFSVEEVFRKDHDGDTLLHIAIILREEAIAASFINMAESSASLSIQNHLFQSPLHLAVLTKQVSIVEDLVNKGADLESRDRDGNTPLHLACRKGLHDIVKIILGYDYVGSRSGTTHNIDLTNYDGQTCLLIAALKQDILLIQMLIKRGADINGRDIKSGRTVLHNMCLTGNLPIVKYLLSVRDCDVNARDYNDCTAFDLARSKGHFHITRELATYGASYSYE